MTEKLRVGIVGAGRIAHNSHVPATMSCPRAQLMAIVDTNEERAAQLAADYGIDVRIAQDLDSVLPDIDAAVICTPNDSHAPIAIQCLSQGRHVLIDKPMATTVSEGRAILGAAERTGAKVGIGYATRFRNGVQLLKEMLDRETFGSVRRFVNRFGTSGGWSPLSGYTLKKSNAGGGVLVVSGTHFLDRMLYWFGPPASCKLMADGLDGPEANCRARFHYDGPPAFEGLAVYSKTANLVAGSVIDTEEGYLILGEFDDSKLVFRPHSQPGIEHEVTRFFEAPYPDGVDSFVLQMDDFVNAVLDDRQPTVDGNQGLMSLELLENLYSSSRLWSYDWYSSKEEVQHG